MYLAGQSVGKVQLTRIGLFYELKCTCVLHDAGMWNLIMTGENGSVHLGLLIPENDGMQLQKRMPVKKMEIDKPIFSLSPREGGNKTVIPIRSDLPFEYLHKLPDSSMVMVDGMPNLSF